MARTPTPGSPAAAGYRRRAEWEPHRCTWLVWPHCQDTWPGLDLGSAVAPAYIEMVRALREGETVRLIAQSDTHAQNVRQRLAAAGIESEIAPSTDEEEDAPPAVPVQLHVWPTDDEWIRDFGALVVRDDEGRRLATDWRFNAWGGKYPRTEQNNTVPELMATVHGLGREPFDVILEGGSIEVNGAGLAMTTESCLLNPNRNPERSRDDIEQLLLDGLGITETIWLGDGIAGDDTDGHVDDFARFVGERIVVVAHEPDASDANHAPLAAAAETLRQWRGRDGRGLEVHTLPMPPALYHEGERLPASYANFLIGNAAVLMPSFGVPQDAAAAETLERLTGRPVVRIPARALVWGLGACHCLSQDVPL
ncbi:MAG TPA: agmatine deiminase family protein [Bacteroidetes bacterium]|nr:agmatine deiminase family protein [Bacteroidota bacterium]HIL58865.1 agmatine deiminase family protein [Rhodothermales bacterium]